MLKLVTQESSTHSELLCQLQETPETKPEPLFDQAGPPRLSHVAQLR